MVNPINHYALENHPTIYDEESLTALQLVARLAAKVNECVSAFNKLDAETKDAIRKLFEEALPEHIVDNVNKWLDDHPEATTTVVDGSLTIEKFADELKMLTDNGYLVPQLFGVVGDGQTDDTAAFQNALNAGKKLYVPNGVYKITAPLTGSNSVIFEKDAVIEYTPSATYEEALRIGGSLTPIAENMGCSINGRVMTIATEYLPDLQAGDYVRIHNNEKVDATAREYDTKADILQIASIDGATITFRSTPVYDYTNVAIDKLNLIENVTVDGVKIRCTSYKDFSSGVHVIYCKNAVVKNCHIVGFDYAGVYLERCVYSDVHSNYAEVSYAEELQYGIVISDCREVAVYGNKINSERTAIDVTYQSNKVTVSNNAVKGNINTHAATNIVIANNTIDEGMILIRAKGVTVKGNHVTSRDDLYCVDIEEMGIAGDHVIEGNTFVGYCSMKAYLTNIRICNNHFIVKKVMSYSNGASESVIRLFNADDSHRITGLVISGNTFDAVDINPIYCIDGYSLLNTIKNVIISDNVIRGFKTAIYVPNLTGIIGDNLIVRNNMLLVTDAGIVYRLTNNVQIVGNTIIATEKGGNGIEQQYGGSTNTEGLIIKGNFIKNFTYGARILGVNSGRAIFADNIFYNCDTRTEGVTGHSEQQPNEVFIASPDGTVHAIKVSDDGVLTAEARSYKV